jgi:hypothetical protein
MKFVELSTSTLFFVVGTRVALGLGLGLLLADRISPEQRRRLALGLIGFGAVTTIPAARAVFASRSQHALTDAIEDYEMASER